MTGDRAAPIMVAMERAQVCPVCGEPFGVYEPLLVIGPGSARRFSLAREPLPGGGETVVHKVCAPASAVALSEN